MNKGTSSSKSEHDKVLALEQKVQSLEHQLDWFKRQLFGGKSEKRLIDEEVIQQGLFTDTDLPASTDTKPTVTVPAYERKKAAHPGTPLDSGLRFDEDQVPMAVIELPSPELEGEQSDEYTDKGEGDLPSGAAYGQLHDPQTSTQGNQASGNRIHH